MDLTRRLALALVAGVLAIGVACTNSGLGLTEDTSEDTETVGDDDDDGAACAWAGDWAITEARCGSFEITDTFGTVYSSVTMKIEDGTDATCEAVVVWEGGGCKERERFHVEPGGGDVEFVSQGIANCNPEGCTFPGETVECVQGDRAGSTSVKVDSSTAGVLEFTGFSPHAYPNCTIDFITKWTKQ